MTPEELMRTVALAIENGDFQPLFDAVDDNIIWKSALGVEGILRFGGEYRKRAGVKDLISHMTKTYVFHQFTPREIVSHGEIAWGLFDTVADHVPTGKTLRFDLAVRWRVRNGKVMEHQGFFDTASVMFEQGDLPHPNS